MALLDRHIDDQLDQRLPAAYTDGEEKEIWDGGVWDAVSPTPRNASAWLADVDLTGWSPNSTGAVGRGCTLITRRHGVTTAHGDLDVGQSMYFVKADGTILTVPVVGMSKNDTSDIKVVAFDDDVDGDIADYKILPADYASYISIADRACFFLKGNTDPPGQAISTFEWASVGLAGGYPRAIFSVPSGSPRDLWNDSPLSGGDSGQPFCLLINGEMVLLATAHGSAFGPALAESAAAINTMSGLADDQAGYDTEYTVTTIELASPSPPIVNAGYFGLLGWITGWLNSAFVAPVPPTIPGLEFTIPENRCHGLLPENRMHGTLLENRMHFTIPEEDRI